MLNVTYAYLAEQADALDRAEVALIPHADDKAREDLCRNRAEFDANLLAPIGRQAHAEKALTSYLGGAA